MTTWILPSLNQSQQLLEAAFFGGQFLPHLCLTCSYGVLKFGLAHLSFARMQRVHIRTSCNNAVQPDIPGSSAIELGRSSTCKA